MIDQGTISIWGEETTKGDMWKTWVEEGELGAGGTVVEGALPLPWRPHPT